MAGLFGGSVERLAAKAQEQMATADSYTITGRGGPAISANIAAVRAVKRLRRIEPVNRRHTAVLATLYYNRAFLCEVIERGASGITYARMSVGNYEWIDPTEGDRIRISEAVASSPPIIDGGGRPIGAAQLIARLADARSRLAYLLGTYGLPGRGRDRELRRFGLDPDLTLRHEINVLDWKSYSAYQALAACSRYTEADADRILEQNGTALERYDARFPD